MFHLLFSFISKTIYILDLFPLVWKQYAYFHVDLFMSIMVLNWPVALATLPIQNLSNSAPVCAFVVWILLTLHPGHITLHYCFMESASAEFSVCPSLIPLINFLKWWHASFSFWYHTELFILSLKLVLGGTRLSRRWLSFWTLESPGAVEAVLIFPWDITVCSGFPPYFY